MFLCAIWFCISVCRPLSLYIDILLLVQYYYYYYYYYSRQVGWTASKNEGFMINNMIQLTIRLFNLFSEGTWFLGNLGNI